MGQQLWSCRCQQSGRLPAGHVDFLNLGNPRRGVRVSAAAAGVGTSWARSGDYYNRERLGVTSSENYHFPQLATLSSQMGLTSSVEKCIQASEGKDFPEGSLSRRTHSGAHPKFGRNTLIFWNQRSV